MQKLPFSELGLSEPVLKAVEKLGFEQTSPIQSAAIPVLMSGRDVVGQSATGSGKTAAFAIPAIERVGDSDRKPQILVLVPTRELATQVAEEFSRLSAFRPKVHAVPIYGGASYERQFSELRKGPQIVIGTPGRVIDHLNRGTLDVSEIKMAVLDECDRMLDMGFREDMERILAGAPKERQTVFFSATLPPAIKRLIETFGKQPEHIKIEGQALTVPTVEQIFFDVPPREKLDALTRLLDVHDARLSIVFANTQRTVDEITDALLARGYAADRLHGGISQALRTRTMGKFKRAEFEILVATDVAGRGLDVDDLDLVINYDLPYDPEDYVHRIGRTGRAGRKGVAMTLVSGREVYRLQYVERFTKQRIRRGRVPTWDQVEEKRLSEVLDKVRATLENGNQSPQAIYIDRLLDEGHAATDLAAALLHQLMESEGLEVRNKAASGDAPAPKGTPAPAPAEAAASGKKKKEKEKPAASPAAESRPAPAQVSPAPVAAKAESVQPEEKAIPAPVAPPAATVPDIPEKEDQPDNPEEVEEIEEDVVSADDTVESAEEPDDDEQEDEVDDDGTVEANDEDDEEEDDDEDDEDEEEEEEEEKPARPAPKVPVKSAPARPKAPQADEDEEEDDEGEAPAPAKRAKAKSGPPTELPPPAPGYRWITINAGKEDGLNPRDIVDAITEDGEIEGKSIGLIKLHDNESHVQIKTAVAPTVIDALQGASLGEKELSVHFARSGAPPRSAEKGRGDRPDRRPGPRRDDDRPRREYGSGGGGFRKPGGPYGARPERPYGGKPGGFAKKPGGFRKETGDRDSRPGGGFRSAGPGGRSFGGKPGGFQKPGGFRSFGENRQGETRSWSRDSEGPGAGGKPRFSRDREDGPPRKKFGGPKKGPGRW